MQQLCWQDVRCICSKSIMRMELVQASKNYNLCSSTQLKNNALQKSSVRRIRMSLSGDGLRWDNILCGREPWDFHHGGMNHAYNRRAKFAVHFCVCDFHSKKPNSISFEYSLRAPQKAHTHTHHASRQHRNMLNKNQIHQNNNWMRNYDLTVSAIMMMLLCSLSLSFASFFCVCFFFLSRLWRCCMCNVGSIHGRSAKIEREKLFWLFGFFLSAVCSVQVHQTGARKTNHV